MNAQCIMICSGKGGTGKSTVSVLLGAGLARLGRKVLLVELDSGLRIPARAVNDMRRQALEQLTQQRASLPLLRENKRQTLQTESRGDFRGYTVQVRQLKQLTDAMAEYARTRGGMTAVEFTGKHYDMGNKLKVVEAQVELALQHPEIGEEFRAYLKEFCKTL